MNSHYVCFLLLGLAFSASSASAMDMDMPPSPAPPKTPTMNLAKFVDPLPDMPRIRGYRPKNGTAKPALLRIGMFQKMWKFHRDLPETTVFAYGLSEDSATVPGPTIEARQGVETRVMWENHLPRSQFLPYDRTLPMAMPKRGGVPTVVHVHGAVTEPESDGNPRAWFTASFKETGPAWTKKLSRYPNVQQPGNLWYHDHALGLTRINALAGLAGAYVIRNYSAERPLGLPRGRRYDRFLVIADKSFLRNGSIFMNATGVDPAVHPQWQPEYFGDVITVNGKAWPFLHVERRKYRFRIINACNSRFLELTLSDSQLDLYQIGSDSAYLQRPVTLRRLLLSPSEIADIVIDFNLTSHKQIVLLNTARAVYPSGPMPDSESRQVLKFRLMEAKAADRSRVPATLIGYPLADERSAVRKRNIALYMYMSKGSDLPTSMLIDAAKFEDPATEVVAEGTSEVWDVINLDTETHPMHVHLGFAAVLRRTELVDLGNFSDCMMMMNDAEMCGLDKHATGKVSPPLPSERGWKNVFPTDPGFVTRVLLRFSLLDGSTSYPFNASAFPGYVYHCHMLDHEDNQMMRPLLVTS